MNPIILIQTQKDIQKLTLFKFLSVIIQLTVVATLQLILFFFIQTKLIFF